MNATARLTKRGLEALRERLFRDPALGTWAVLDGARAERLVRTIGAHGAESSCLLAGKLEPSIARVAPYLVRLERDAPFTAWLLERGFGKSWGIFVRAAAPTQAVRRHLKRFLLVKDPAGRRLFFRFYDPRVLRLYLPTLIEEETRAFFGPLAAFAMESDGARALLVFTPDGAPPREQRIALDESPLTAPSSGPAPAR